jgi:hypothetical protein
VSVGAVLGVLVMLLVMRFCCLAAAAILLGGLEGQGQGSHAFEVCRWPSGHCRRRPGLGHRTSGRGL